MSTESALRAECLEAKTPSTIEFVRRDTTHPRLTHAELSSRLQAIVSEHGPFVIRKLRQFGIRDIELDDVTQEVFLVVHRRLADYAELGRARAWLYSICRRVVHTHRRRKLRWNSQSLPYAENDLASEPTQLEQVERAESLRAGYRLLECLSADQRQVFWLYEVEDVPMREIAEVLGVHIQTAYARLYRARERVLAAADAARPAG